MFTLVAVLATETDIAVFPGCKLFARAHAIVLSSEIDVVVGFRMQVVCSRSRDCSGCLTFLAAIVVFSSYADDAEGRRRRVEI